MRKNSGVFISSLGSGELEILRETIEELDRIFGRLRESEAQGLRIKMV